MSHAQHPLEERDPSRLSEGEWRVLMSYRMGQIEARVDALFKLLGLIAVGLIVGVLSFWLTSGGPH